MRRAFITLTTILAASTFAVGSQLPLGTKNPGKAMSDPSFPQSGLLGTEGPIPQAGQGATLAEALTVDRRAGVWWDYARDVSSIANRVLGRVMLAYFQTARLSARGAKDTTILVPIDGAIMRLPNKPYVWLGRYEYGQAEI